MPLSEELSYRNASQTLTKRCSNCGYVVEKLPLNIREWDCPECGSHHDRDINASINILRMGTRVGVSFSSSGGG
ncbi:zinc ribbon domain-containing protein [Okeania sp. KiyG1]|uniref:zinc ribbon domain-containing protein n=1 Tax=Okeania sp. KiyG1 TaxID=2720165 RepID=UPI00192432D1